MPASPLAQVGSAAQPALTHAAQVLVRVSQVKSTTQVLATHTPSLPAVSVHCWLGTHVPAARSIAHVTGERHFTVVASQVSPPVHTFPAPQGQSRRSALQVWHTCAPSQYPVPSHFGAPARQGQLVAPAVQLLGMQVPVVQVSPLLQTSPVPHAQPCAPAGHASQAALAQRSPVLQVAFARQMQAASPRRQSTHEPPMHSPTEQVVPPVHAQPTWPTHEGVPPSSPG
jgi:hypothetical protein